MDRSRLLESLDELHGELATEPALDAELRSRLLQLAEEIQAAVARSAPDEDRSALALRLSDQVESFEASHPRLTAAVNRLADALAGMGI